MASMQHENRVVSETTVHRTVSIPERIEYGHSKKIFLNILEAKYLVEKGLEPREKGESNRPFHGIRVLFRA